MNSRPARRTDDMRTFRVVLFLTCFTMVSARDLSNCSRREVDCPGMDAIDNGDKRLPVAKPS